MDADERRRTRALGSVARARASTDARGGVDGEDGGAATRAARMDAASSDADAAVDDDDDGDGELGWDGGLDRAAHRATLDALRALREQQTRMNGKISWLARSVPKIYDAVVNDAVVNDATSSIEELRRSVDALSVRLDAVVGSGRFASSASGERAGRAPAAADGRLATASDRAAPSRSRSPGAKTPIKSVGRVVSIRTTFGEAVNEENEDVVSQMPRVGRVGDAEDERANASARSKFENKFKEKDRRASEAKDIDPRKWTQEKWISHLRSTTPKFFEALDDVSIVDILDGAKCFFVQRGARLVRQGERGSSMFIIVLGKVHVIHTDPLKNRGEPLQVATLQQGDFFGEIALMTGEERRATVMAPYEGDGNVWVLELSKVDIGSVILARPNVMRALTDVCADRRLEKLA